MGRKPTERHWGDADVSGTGRRALHGRYFRDAGRVGGKLVPGQAGEVGLSREMVLLMMS